MSQQKDSEEQGWAEVCPASFAVVETLAEIPSASMSGVRGKLDQSIQSDYAVEALAIRGPCPGMT